MNENDLFNFQLEYTFTADWLAELDRQLPSCCPHGREPCRWIGLSA